MLPRAWTFRTASGCLQRMVAAILIGLLGAGHQAWSANLFSTIGDMFPKSTIGTIVGLGTMAGGLGSMSINLGSGKFFDWANSLRDLLSHSLVSRESLPLTWWCSASVPLPT